MAASTTETHPKERPKETEEASGIRWSPRQQMEAKKPRKFESGMLMFEEAWGHFGYVKIKHLK